MGNERLTEAKAKELDELAGYVKKRMEEIGVCCALRYSTFYGAPEILILSDENDGIMREPWMERVEREYVDGHPEYIWVRGSVGENVRFLDLEDNNGDL